jgi:LacI family transcriptional regulator
MPTMRDVARLAEVSTATVSRALADGGPRVKPETRERVLRAVAELDYHPNHLPRNMRRRSSRILGLVVSDIGNPFFTAIARGCEDVAQSRGYSFVLANTDEDTDREAARLHTIASERAAGVILASTDEATEPIRRLVATGIPVVALDRRIDGIDVDTVTVDNETASYQAIRHLLELGHERVAMIAGPAARSSIRERADGYRRALREHRLHLGDGLLRRGDLRETGGYRMTLDLLDADEPPTAIFSVNNLTTIGVLRALRERGLRIPADLSLIGFDDLPTGELLDPPLTAVVQPTYQLGVRSAELLLRRVENREAPVQEVVLGATLTIRGSTGPPAAAVRA